MVAPIIAPGRAGDFRARQCFQLRLDRLLHLVCERRVIGDQDRLRGFVMLGLRQEIGGDPVRVSGLVGDDQDFGRPRDHVDADLAEHDTFGGGDIGVAGTDDLGDRLDLCVP